MRIRTAVAVILLSGLACLGVPSAAADELLSTHAETSESGEPADEPVVPALDPSDEQTTEVTPPEPEESATPTESTEPTGKDSTASSEPTGETTQDVNPAQPAGETGNTLTVETSEATASKSASAEASLAAAAAGDGRDPRADIGDINCTNLTIPVTLDNSRLTATAVTYQIWAAEFDAEEDEPTLTVQVPAGAIRTVDVPVIEDRRFVVAVVEPLGRRSDFLPESRPLAYADLLIDCRADAGQRDSQARIGSVDCASMTVDVTLNNSRSDVETTYRVYAFTNEDVLVYDHSFDVPQGDVQTVQVPVTENLRVTVGVYDPDVLGPDEEKDGHLAAEEFGVNCTPGDGPLASIGKVNCTDRTVAVTLDNTRSSVETTFLVMAGVIESFEPTYNESFDVAAGADRVLLVPVPNTAEVAVGVAHGEFFRPENVLTLDFLELGCERVPAGRGVPRPAGGSGAPAGAGAALAATGGFNSTLPLLGIALTAAGGLLTLTGRRRRH